jgi:hypothetical protein
MGTKAKNGITDHAPTLKRGGKAGSQVTIVINGYPYYIEQVDSTHLKMATIKDNLPKTIPYHVSQYKGLSYYEDLKNWLHGENLRMNTKYIQDMEDGGQLSSVSDMLPSPEPMGVIQPMNIMETVDPMADGGEALSSVSKMAVLRDLLKEYSANKYGEQFEQSTFTEYDEGVGGKTKSGQVVEVTYDELFSTNYAQGGDLTAPEKFRFVMGEFKDGTLESGSGHKVTDKDQAFAIAYSEARKINKGFGRYDGGGDTDDGSGLYMLDLTRWNDDGEGDAIKDAIKEVDKSANVTFNDNHIEVKSISLAKAREIYEGLQANFRYLNAELYSETHKKWDNPLRLRKNIWDDPFHADYPLDYEGGGDIDKQEVVDAVLEQMKRNISDGDITVEEELFMMLDKEFLVQSILKEEDWDKFRKGSKQEVVDALLEQTKKDYRDGDLTVVDYMFMQLPKKNLIQALPEEEWHKYSKGGSTYAGGGEMFGGRFTKSDYNRLTDEDSPFYSTLDGDYWTIKDEETDEEVARWYINEEELRTIGYGNNRFSDWLETNSYSIQRLANGGEISSDVEKVMMKHYPDGEIMMLQALGKNDIVEIGWDKKGRSTVRIFDLKGNLLDTGKTNAKAKDTLDSIHDKIKDYDIRYDSMGYKAVYLAPTYAGGGHIFGSNFSLDEVIEAQKEAVKNDYDLSIDTGYEEQDDFSDSPYELSVEDVGNAFYSSEAERDSDYEILIKAVAPYRMSEIGSASADGGGLGADDLEYRKLYEINKDKLTYNGEKNGKYYFATEYHQEVVHTKDFLDKAEIIAVHAGGGQLGYDNLEYYDDGDGIDYDYWIDPKTKQVYYVPMEIVRDFSEPIEEGFTESDLEYIDDKHSELEVWVHEKSGKEYLIETERVRNFSNASAEQIDKDWSEDSYSGGGEIDYKNVSKRREEVKEFWEKYNYDPNQLAGGMGAGDKPNSIVVRQYGYYNSLYKYNEELVDEELTELQGSDYKGGVLVDVFTITDGGFIVSYGYVLNKNGKNIAYVADPESKIAYIVGRKGYSKGGSTYAGGGDLSALHVGILQDEEEADWGWTGQAILDKANDYPDEERTEKFTNLSEAIEYLAGWEEYFKLESEVLKEAKEQGFDAPKEELETDDIWTIVRGYSDGGDTDLDLDMAQWVSKYSKEEAEQDFNIKFISKAEAKKMIEDNPDVEIFNEYKSYANEDEDVLESAEVLYIENTSMKTGGDTAVAEKPNKYKKGVAHNEDIKRILALNGTDRMKYSEANLQTLPSYHYSHYIPKELANKMWGLARKHGFEFDNKRISAFNIGNGDLLRYIPENMAIVDAVEPDKYLRTISKVLFANKRVKIHKSYSPFVTRKKQYNLAIGVYPSYPEAGGIGIELTLKSGGLLVAVIPNYIFGDSQPVKDIQAQMNSLFELKEAYRLPSDIMDGYSLIVLKRK